MLWFRQHATKWTLTNQVQDHLEVEIARKQQQGNMDGNENARWVLTLTTKILYQLHFDLFLLHRIFYHPKNLDLS